MIKLRHVTKDDSNRLLEWRNLPEVARYMYTDHNISISEHTKWFENMLQDDKKLYWIIELDSIPVGVANIVNINQTHKNCFWAFYLASPDVRGRGVGSYVEYFIMNYVFNVMNFHKLSCEVLSFNENVIEMHKSFGFQQEGIFREHIFKNNEWHDIIRLSILKNEWQIIKKNIENSLQKKGLLNA